MGFWVRVGGEQGRSLLHQQSQCGLQDVFNEQRGASCQMTKRTAVIWADRLPSRRSDEDGIDPAVNPFPNTADSDVPVIFGSESGHVLPCPFMGLLHLVQRRIFVADSLLVVIPDN